MRPDAGERAARAMRAPHVRGGVKRGHRAAQWGRKNRKIACAAQFRVLSPFRRAVEVMLPSEAAAEVEAAKPPEPQKQPLTAAQEKRIRDKVACDKLVYEMQMQLLDGAISAEVRAEAAGLLQPQHYDDVVSERGIDGLCGYVGCANPVKKPGTGPRYHVSLSEHKVYDKASMHEFCSRDCTRRSQEFAQSLSTTSLFLRKGAAALPAAASAVGDVGAPATSSQPPPSGPQGARAPVATGAPFDGRPASHIMVGQLAERTHHLPPQPPQAPRRPDLVEGHPVPFTTTPVLRKPAPSAEDVAAGLSQVDLSASGGNWG